MIFALNLVSFALLLSPVACFVARPSSCRLQSKYMLQASGSDELQPVSQKDSLAKYVNTAQGVVKVAAFTALSSTMFNAASVFAKGTTDFSAVREEIGKIYKEDANKGPTLVRLAWHSSATYDKMSKTGGSEKGTIRFKEELAHGGNAGLNNAVAWMEPIYQKFQSSGLSYADLYTLAGVESIRLMGGPSIKWRAGRVDSMDPADVTPDGRLPSADKGSPQSTAQHLRDIFARMGFADKDLVVLSGAHALGRCHASNSGYEGPWTPTPTTFNNLYFSLLLNLQWTPNDAAAKFQYKDPSGRLMMLPSDIVLIQDPKFKKYVEVYAKDQKAFFTDFASAFQRLEELGTKNLYEV